jgi:hypothetical protein
MLHTFAKELDTRVYIPEFFDESPVSFSVFTNPEARKNFDLKQFNITNSNYTCESLDARCRQNHPQSARCQNLGCSWRNIRSYMLISFQYCWGANGLFLIADSAKELFDACIIVHPGPLEFPKDFERVDGSTPWYFQWAEWDQWFLDDQRDEARKYLQGKGINVKLSVYEKTVHGFAVLVSLHGILTLDLRRSFG